MSNIICNKKEEYNNKLIFGYARRYTDDFYYDLYKVISKYAARLIGNKEKTLEVKDIKCIILQSKNSQNVYIHRSISSPENDGLIRLNTENLSHLTSKVFFIAGNHLLIGFNKVDGSPDNSFFVFAPRKRLLLEIEHKNVGPIKKVAIFKESLHTNNHTNFFQLKGSKKLIFVLNDKIKMVDADNTKNAVDLLDDPEATYTKAQELKDGSLLVYDESQGCLHLSNPRHLKDGESVQVTPLQPSTQCLPKSITEVGNKIMMFSEDLSTLLVWDRKDLSNPVTFWGHFSHQGESSDYFLGENPIVKSFKEDEIITSFRGMVVKCNLKDPDSEPTILGGNSSTKFTYIIPLEGGKKVACGFASGEVHLFDLANSKQKPLILNLKKSIDKLVELKDGTLLIAQKGGKMGVWNWELSRYSELKDGHKSDILSIVEVKSNGKVVSGSKDGEVITWS